MLKRITLDINDIKLNQPLSWSVFSADGTLLLREGSVVSSQRQIDIVMEKGCLRGASKKEIEHHEEEESLKKKKKKRYFSDNIFKIKNHCAKETEEMLSRLVTSRSVDVVEATTTIFKLIEKACNDDANAALAAVHLSKDFGYSVLHPLHSAILCKILISRLSFNVEQQRTIIAAALTMNVGMYELQEKLFSQKGGLSADQKKSIFEHPKRSVEILKKAGVEDKAWLDIILQHHERVDGDGYPNKKTGSEIHQGAKVVALADVYSAMITPRMHRAPIAAQDALREIFSTRGQDVDEKLAQMLISEVGVFPPGSFVTLDNGETALVIKRAVSRGGEKTSPAVCSILAPTGDRYERFIMRDTAIAHYKIKVACKPEIKGAIDYPLLWGYQ